jgi:hypothetical protein
MSSEILVNTLQSLAKAGTTGTSQDHLEAIAKKLQVDADFRYETIDQQTSLSTMSLGQDSRDTHGSILSPIRVLSLIQGRVEPSHWCVE